MNLQCPLCKQAYDNERKIPMVICNQHHLSCEDCVNQLYQSKGRKNCPECRQELNKEKIIKFRLFFICQQKIKRQKQLLRKQQQQFQLKQTEISTQYKQIIEYLIAHNSFSKRQYYETIKSKAEKLIQKKLYGTATLLLENLIQKHALQSNQYPFFGIGSLKEEVGYSQNCELNWFKQRNKVQNLCAEDILAFVNLRNPQYDSQKQFYQKILSNKPTCYKILFGLALTEHNAANLDEALSLYKKIIELKPDFSKAYEQMAFIYQQQQNTQLQIKYCNQCLKIQPNNIFAHFIITAQIQDEEQLIQSINRILQIEPKYCKPITVLADYYKNSNEYQKAIKEHLRCIQINKEYIDPILGLGECYLQMGKYNYAIKTLMQIDNKIKSKNQTYDYYLNIGIAYKSMGKYNESIEWFKKCIFTDSSCKLANKRLGQVYKKLGRYEDALNIYKDLVSLNPTSQIYLKIVEIATRNKNYSDTVFWLKKWLQIEPDDIEIHAALADNNYSMNNLEDSLNFCRSCITNNYETGKYYDLSIEILQKQKKYEQLIKQIKSYIKQCDLPWEKIEKLTKLGNKFDSILQRAIKVEN